MIASLMKSERPRERCLKAGSEVLSLRECLAVVLGSGPPDKGSLGLSQEILVTLSGSLEEGMQAAKFFECSDEEFLVLLRPIRGVGPARLAKLLAMREVARKRALHMMSSQGRAHSQMLTIERAVAMIPSHLRHETYEWIGFVPVTKTRTMGAFCLVARGTAVMVNVDVQNFAACILASRPRGIFLFHNHPSGEANASSHDRDLSDQAEVLARVLNIEFLGHWIVTSQSHHEVC